MHIHSTSAPIYQAVCLNQKGGTITMYSGWKLEISQCVNDIQLSMHIYLPETPTIELKHCVIYLGHIL